MQIEFTKEQYLKLMKLVYFGNWVVNATRNPNEQLEEYREIENYIFSFASEFGFDDFVDEEEKDKGIFYPTRIFEEETDIPELLEYYENEVFWEELIDRMGDRDFLREYGEAAIEEMAPEERFVKAMEFQQKYDEEFEENGIERLDVMEG
ncbi:MAG: hypothetical protein V1770_06080 [bacterium]